MIDYEPGTVLLYAPPHHPHEWEGIVVDEWNGQAYHRVTYRVVGENKWRQRGAFLKDHVRPHPDPDPVWAAYCAALLTGEVCDV